jgi:hypothetical protein
MLKANGKNLDKNGQNLIGLKKSSKKSEELNSIARKMKL